MDFQAVIQLKDRTQIADYIKAQTASHLSFKYKNKGYSRVDRARS